MEHTRNIEHTKNIEYTRNIEHIDGCPFFPVRVDRIIQERR